MSTSPLWACRRVTRDDQTVPSMSRTTARHSCGFPCRSSYYSGSMVLMMGKMRVLSVHTSSISRMPVFSIFVLFYITINEFLTPSNNIASTLLSTDSF